MCLAVSNKFIQPLWLDIRLSATSVWPRKWMAIKVLKQTFFFLKQPEAQRMLQNRKGASGGGCVFISESQTESQKRASGWVTLIKWALHWQTVILKWTSNEICPLDYRDAVSKVDQTESFDLFFSPFPVSPCSLSPLSFSQDVPKDYRHVSLTGVKQRFEDEAYQHISKEEVLSFCFYYVFFQLRKSILFLYISIL